MIFIFEDKAESPLSKLYTDLYKDCNDLEIIYSNGNGGLYNRINERFRESSDYIVVFIDVVPDNIETIRLYRRLYRIFEYSQSTKRVFIMPIICAEYNYMLSLDLELATDLNEVRNCIELSLDNYSSNFKNYEKYCKHVVKNCFDICVGDRSNFKYTEANCDSACCRFKNCREIKRVDKAVRLVTKYPVFFELPINSNKYTELSNYNDLCKIRENIMTRLIGLENSMIDKSILSQKRINLEVK